MFADRPAYCAHFLSLSALGRADPALFAAVEGAWGAALRAAAARRSAIEREVGRPTDGRPPTLRQFLAGLGMLRFLPRLEQNEIDLEAMALCSDSDFAEMGIPKGPRVRIARALTELQKEGERAAAPAAAAAAVPLPSPGASPSAKSVRTRGPGAGGGRVQGWGKPRQGPGAGPRTATEKAQSAGSVPVSSPAAVWVDPLQQPEPEPAPADDDLVSLAQNLIDSFDDDWDLPVPLPGSASLVSCRLRPVGAACCPVACKMAICSRSVNDQLPGCSDDLCAMFSRPCCPVRRLNPPRVMARLRRRRHLRDPTCARPAPGRRRIG